MFVVHNGIVENFSELRSEIENSGSNLNSDTDSETIPHLIESYLSQSNNLEEAVMFAAKKIKGANSIVVMSKKSPEKINKIAIETTADLIKQIIGADVNNSNISAIVEDISKRNPEKYYDN